MTSGFRVSPFDGTRPHLVKAEAMPGVWVRPADQAMLALGNRQLWATFSEGHGTGDPIGEFEEDDDGLIVSVQKDELGNRWCLVLTSRGRLGWIVFSWLWKAVP
jgi:hypothetical protein